jgi:hypothetical protein
MATRSCTTCENTIENQFINNTEHYLFSHLVELVNANDAAICEYHGAGL